MEGNVGGVVEHIQAVLNSNLDLAQGIHALNRSHCRQQLLLEPKIPQTRSDSSQITQQLLLTVVERERGLDRLVGGERRYSQC